uniref:Small integral membrane protein 20 n=1 Tax=Bursaphelenchus xylophilus TaxID=6326 RepID=A0A1I7SWH9_BURXY
MRVPKGAPVAGLLYWKQKFPFLNRFQRPTMGTAAVGGCVGLTILGILVMIVQPYVYNDYYKGVQAHKRSLMNADREKLANGLRPWSDPFKSPK